MKTKNCFVVSICLLLAACAPSVAEIEANEQARASAKAHNLLFGVCLQLQAVSDPDGFYDLDYGPLEAIIFQAEGLDRRLSTEVAVVVTGLAELDIELGKFGDEIDAAESRALQGFDVDTEELSRRLDGFKEKSSAFKAEIDLACAEFAVEVELPDRPE